VLVSKKKRLKKFKSWDGRVYLLISKYTCSEKEEEQILHLTDEKNTEKNSAKRKKRGQNPA